MIAVKISLPYGKKRTVDIEIPDENVYFTVDRGDVPTLKNVEAVIKRGLRKPIGASPLHEMVRSGDRIVIVGDDITRPTPQDVIIPVLLDELNGAGVPDDCVDVIVALGTHRQMSTREIREKYGGEVVERVSVVNHDFSDRDQLVDLGRTESGTPILVNKAVCRADLVIGVGNIVPHCYAGWGGGGKIIQPGVCGEETTGMTHLMAGKKRPVSKLFGRLDNEVRREIDAIALKAGLKMIINTVLNRDDEITRVVIGGPIEALERGIEAAKDIYCPPVPGYADIVVVSSYPADIDYWQALKALSYASVAVKRGGTIILITPCPDRISPMHPSFKERAAFTYDENLRDIKDGTIEDLVAGGALLIHGQLLERAEVVCYSEGLTGGDNEALGFVRVNTIEEAVEMAFRSQGKKAKVGILGCGEILPVIEKAA